MAHPGIWGLAGLSVALIAAGVWLNRPDRQEVARTPAPQDLQVTGVAPEPASSVATAPEARTEAAPPESPTESPTGSRVEPGAEPRAEQMAEPEPEAPPSLSSKDDLQPPSPTSSPEPEPGTEPEPGAAEDPQPEDPEHPAPQPGATGPAVPEPAPEPAPEAALVEDHVEGPLVFTGPDIWLQATDANVTPEIIAQATRAADTMPGGPLAYGAIASPRARPARRFVVHGYNELAQAEAHALALCSRFQTDCVILAWRVPADWDGSYEGTLGSRQRAAWDAFSGPLPPGAFRAFAISAEGATGQAEGDTMVAARAFAMVDCLRDQERVRQPGIEVGGCQVIALRGP